MNPIGLFDFYRGDADDVGFGNVRGRLIRVEWADLLMRSDAFLSINTVCPFNRYRKSKISPTPFSYGWGLGKWWVGTGPTCEFGNNKTSNVSQYDTAFSQFVSEKYAYA